MSWIDRLNFKQAVQEIVTDEKNGKDFCLDPLRFADLHNKSVQDILVNTVINRLTKGQCDDLISIDYPKENYILRPGARPNLMDWVAYQALVNYIGSFIYPNIPNKSYSFEIFKNKFKTKNYKRNIDYWLSFEDKVSDYVNKYPIMLVTDIVSFYENISIQELKERLLLISDNNRDYISAVSLLIDNFLIKWTKKNRVEDFGLPQGPYASTVLADIYLYLLDRTMINNKIPYFRYMDDIRVFAKSKNALKRSLIILVRCLRDLKLNLNAKKTLIYNTENKESLKRSIDPERETLSSIDKAFKSRRKDQINLVIPLLKRIHKYSKEPNNPFSQRYIKFFISRMVDLMKFNLLSDKNLKILLDDSINLFSQSHHLSNVLCWFFCAANKYNKQLGSVIKEKLIDFIVDKDRNIYEWQEMWALDTIRQIGRLTKKELVTLKRNVSSHELCQAQLCLILSKNGGIDDKEEMLEKIVKNNLRNDQYRYYYLAVQKLHNNVLSKVERKIPIYFRKYIQSIGKEIYGYEYFLEEMHPIVDMTPY